MKDFLINMESELNNNNNRLLEIKGLKTHFVQKIGSPLMAVDGIDLAVKPGEIHGIVGESGSGKTVAALSVLRLVPFPGKIKAKGIYWNGIDLLSLSEKEIRKIRGSNIAMIFQSPQQSLNPLYTVGQQITDIIKLHNKGISKQKAREESVKWLNEVKIPEPEKRMDDYPHQLSGGMCQRVMIAMALACKPKFLIADEPTASLDVTIQAQILDLLLDIREKYNMSMLFISHDLGVVAKVCDQVSVMYLGKILESADVDTIYNKPAHPYTKALLEAVPLPVPGDKTRMEGIKGDIPELGEIGSGCRFKNRCPSAFDKCSDLPPMMSWNGSDVACWLYNKNEKVI
jgi:peptide/nickel transport system ATP-binding protein